MGSLPSDAKLPWIKTPCVFSPPLSKVAGCNIYLKLDNLQPSGSFKSRGIGNFMMKAAAATASSSSAPGASPAHFYCPSGGNAGLACAASAAALKLPATIVVPTLTSQFMIAKLRQLGVEVQQVGENWAAANRHIHEVLLPADPAGVYVPPFDHQDVWDGHATIVEELREQLGGEGIVVDGIVGSVGGGGMINGIMQGVEAAPWPGTTDSKPRVLAVETIGCDSLNASVRAGQHVSLPGITSIAISLGATRVCEQTWLWSQRGNMDSVVVTDADAAVSCVRFADDARFLVEAACGATLAVAYRGDLRAWLGEGLSDEEWAQKNVVLQVCGGSTVSLEVLEAYRSKYGPESSIKL